MNQIQIFFILIGLSLLPSCQHISSNRKTANRELNNLKQVKIVPIKNRQQWHLSRTKTDKAWKISKGSKDITVAIIDTGIDVNHRDLRDNLWVNRAEHEGIRGVDDDKNGYIDDIHGWNYSDNNADVMDHHGHGTHVAGIIGGRGEICKSGIAPQVRLMILKYYNPNASGAVNLDNTIKSIQYAVKNGADIINFSGGGFEPNKREKEAIRQAFKKNILFVTAAGNEYSNLKKKPFYPASYKGLPNILSVGASDFSDNNASFSNFSKIRESSSDSAGAISVHAPGTKIYSTLPKNKCGFLTGTSQSTPIFSGGAVLIKAHKKHLDTPEKIINHLIGTAAQNKNLKGKSRSGGVANFHLTLGSDIASVFINGKGKVDKDIPKKLKEYQGLSDLQLATENAYKKWSNRKTASKGKPVSNRKPSSIDSSKKETRIELIAPSSWIPLFQ